MNHRLIDLPLLAALDALVSERSVTRAADRLHMSQPAMSHALAKLRAAFGDPILVKSHGAMVPTAKALRIVGPTREAVQSLESALAGFRNFDPGTEESVIRLAVVDYVELVIMPKVMSLLREKAPGLRVLVRPLWSQQDLVDDLHSGRLDLAMAFFGEPPDLLRRQRLGQEEYVCIAARGRFRKGKFDLGAYLAGRHVVVNPVGVFEAPVIDGALRKKGLRREVVYSAAHFTTAAAIVESTDLIATVQGRVANRMLREFAIDVLPLPFAAPGLVLSQIWHERTHKDDLFRWLRSQFEVACQEIFSAPTRRVQRIRAPNTPDRNI